MTRYDSEEMEQDRYKMFLNILDNDPIPGIDMYGVVKDMKKLKSEVIILEDGTLVVKNLPKEYFDIIGRVIIDNDNDFGLPVSKTFYQE